MDPLADKILVAAALLFWSSFRFYLLGLCSSFLVREFIHDRSHERREVIAVELVR